MSIGDRVMHDFSQTFGTVIEIRYYAKKYPFKVQWDNGREDWYDRHVLVVTEEDRCKHTFSTANDSTDSSCDKCGVLQSEARS